jgi:ATP-dependent Clp protease adapter protein ClpS
VALSSILAMPSWTLSTVAVPDSQTSLPGAGGRGRWALVIFNNESNSFEDVIFILMKATGCDVQEATIETWEAHHYGKAMVHFGDKSECEAAARVVQSIGVQTEVRPEWGEE